MSRSWLIVVSLVLLVGGLFVVFRSIAWGSAAANAYLQSQGGMDTAQFMVIFQEYINIYRWVGNILAFIGGLGLVKAIEVK